MQIIIRRDQKAFLNKQCKEIEETSRMRKTDLFKKIGDIKGTFHVRVGIIKDLIGVTSECPSGFTSFLQFKPEFCNKDPMI